LATRRRIEVRASLPEEKRKRQEHRNKKNHPQFDLGKPLLAPPGQT